MTGNSLSNAADGYWHVDRGLRRFVQGALQAAYCEFCEAAATDPLDPLAHYLSGVALQALGLPDEARTEWRLVLALTSSHHSPATDRDWACVMAQRLLVQAG